MRLLSTVLIPLGLVTVSFSARADDSPSRLPSLPTLTPDDVPNSGHPAPPGASSAGEKVPGDHVPPGVPAAPPIVDPAPPASRATVQPWRVQTYSSTIDQFQSSDYWFHPRPFAPARAPDYGSGLAWGEGVHVRYPYFKYRAPWTYQGPAAISHTIHW